MWMLEWEADLSNFRDAFVVRASHPKYSERFYVVSTSVIDEGDVRLKVDETMVMPAKSSGVLNPRTGSRSWDIYGWHAVIYSATTKPHDPWLSMTRLLEYLEACSGGAWGSSDTILANAVKSLERT